MTPDESMHFFARARKCWNSPKRIPLCDHRALRRYGLGFAKPFPLPIGHLLRSGYLLCGKTLADLAKVTGTDAAVLQRTAESVNADASRGEDKQFGKGSTAYNRFLGVANHKPNPCVAPIERGPFYAVKILLGDLGTFAGIRTDEYARVLDRSGQPIAGIYAVGNDAASVMGGNYPGGGITPGPAMTFGYIAGQHLAARRDNENRSEKYEVASPAPVREGVGA